MKSNKPDPSKRKTVDLTVRGTPRKSAAGRPFANRPKTMPRVSEECHAQLLMIQEHVGLPSLAQTIEHVAQLAFTKLKLPAPATR